MTRSRNLSHIPVASRSFDVCVAVVIRQKIRTQTISTSVDILWKASLRQTFRWLSAFPAPGLCLWPLMPSARRHRVSLAPLTAAFSTARDCLRLAIPRQAKSVRRPVVACTLHSQLFHKHKNYVTRRAFALGTVYFRGKPHFAGNSRTTEFIRQTDARYFTCGKEFAQSAEKILQRLAGRSNS